MTGWLAAKGLFSLANKAWVGIALLGTLLLIWAIVGSINNTVTTITETAKESGKQEAVIQGQTQTLEQLGDANEGEAEIDRGERNSVRYAECLRNSRRPAACERYNPNEGTE